MGRDRRLCPFLWCSTRRLDMSQRFLPLASVAVVIGVASLALTTVAGQAPPAQAGAKRLADAEQGFRLALLQATETCRQQEAGCAGGTFGPPSPKRNETPVRYNTGRLNRNNGPEDRSMSERCMAATLPDFGGYRR